MKREAFVTLFDRNYLPQGLTLYYSMISRGVKFTLFILCLDKETYKILKKQNNKNIKLLDLEDFENDELKNKKKSRKKSEYCWTLTSWAIQWCLEKNPQINRITYLDADLYFLKNPRFIFDEFDKSKKSVLITKHSYSPEYDQSLTSGTYCVQFLIVSRGEGEIILHDWRDKCMNWCFDYFDNGKYGDQKYLDEWPVKYSDLVHVLANECAAQGPWNAKRFPYSDAIFFHFHGLKILSQKNIFLSTYYLPRPTYINVYKPYIGEIKKTLNNLKIYNYKIINKNHLLRRMPILFSFFYKLRDTLRRYLIPVFVKF